MRKVIAVAVATLLLGSMFYSGADARPQYKSALGKKYTKIKASCTTCHEKKADGKTDTKKRNNYGTAVGKAIGKKNEKDKTKINDGLDKAAKEKSAIDGKTFGDLLDEGKAPSSTK